MNAMEIDADYFWREGYLVLKNAFSKDDIKQLRIKAILDRENGEAQFDLLNKSDEIFNKLVTDSIIVDAATKILGEKPVYFGDSSITYGSFHRGWHKDNRFPDRFKHNYSDWKGRYTMLRFGIYLQDHSYYSGGLGIRAKSHNPSKLVNLIGKLKIPLLGSLRNERIKTRLQIIASLLYGKAKMLNSEPGDLLIWAQTTTHSGNALRLKMLPNLKLPTWLENRLPDFLVRPYQDDRIAIFLAYGCQDEHLRRGLDFLKSRDYMVNKWEIYKNKTHPSTEKLKIMSYQDIYS